MGAPGAGLVISGAKVVATGSVLTNYAFVAHHGLIPVQDKKFAAVFILPTNSPGVNPDLSDRGELSYYTMRGAK